MNAHAPINQQVLLAVIRSASASARLAVNDLDAISTMLKAGWITCQEAIEALAELGLIDPAVVDAGWKEAAAEYRRDHPIPPLRGKWSNFAEACALAERQARRNPPPKRIPRNDECAGTMTTLALALDYAARGFAVFPLLEKRKEPATSRGFKDATTNPATIRRWWGGIHNYNIGIATGLASGVWVFDVDGSIGAFALAELEAKHGPLSKTLCSTTSAGTHFWFRATGPLQKSEDRVGPKLDVRADGGYAVVPPSVHPDGPVYRWTNDRPPAVAPEWLVKLAKQRPGAPKIIIPEATCRRQGSPGAYGQAALDGEYEVLAKTPPGRRNHQLNLSTFRLYQLAAGGELEDAAIEAAMIQACVANGLVADDGLRSVEKTIQSARAGLQCPRGRAPR